MKKRNWMLTSAIGITVALTGMASLQSAKTVDKDFVSMKWSEVQREARGQTVNWFMWGGSESINRFVDQTYGTELKKYGVTLKRVPLNDTVDAVNKVLGEKLAGKNAGGSVDAIWINGENFKTAKQGKLLFEGWATKLPNARFVDWKNPSVAFDFGYAVDGAESPWGSAQWQYVYDTSRISEAQLPKSFSALLAWAKAHPGRFTFPAPPNYLGNRLLRMMLFELSGGREVFNGAFNEKIWLEKSPALWAYLREIRPYLWRAGQTFPKDAADLDQLFVNNEIDFTASQEKGGITSAVKAGRLPKTSKLFLFDAGTIADYNYIGIPYNAANKAAALLLANVLLEPKLQLKMANPNSIGFGLGIDPNKLSNANKIALSQVLVAGAYTLPPNLLAAKAIGDIAAEYDKRVQDGFKSIILGQ